jgi:hypothetical protein
MAMNLMMNSMMSRSAGGIGMNFGQGMEKEEQSTLLTAVSQTAKFVVAGIQKR